MGKINILSAELSNKIAAGEVVERPSSVVKELLENSIDAGSTNIKIIIKEFGIKQIRIIDNGSGISNDDLGKAFLRHATSKINNDYDLFHIDTLGFRGEALASIASVSKVIIKSCSGEMQGKMMTLESGKVVKDEWYAPIKGTDISVENLFYNTPARLKYLRNPHTEQANIMNVINKFALSYPNIAFEVHVDGKILLKTYGDGNIHKIISKIYSMTVAKNMIEFSGNNDDYEIKGYISVPEETRASKNYINIFINGRYIRNYIIQNSIVAAYGTLLMKNRYPLCIIDIRMDPVLLDVNVHPTKQEVRLSKETELVTLIKRVIFDRLSNYTYIPQGMNNVLTKKEKEHIEKINLLEELDNKYIIKENEFNFGDKEDLELIKRNYDNKENSIYNTTDSKLKFTPNPQLRRKNSSNEKPTVKEIENFMNFSKNEEFDDYNSSDEIKNVAADFEINKGIDYKQEPETKTKILPDLKVLAQIFKTYILAEADNKIFLIDQHAAAERYNYEKLQKEFSQKANYKKQLLVPLMFNFSVEEVADIKSNMEKFKELGIEFEEFGNNSYVVREFPLWAAEESEEVIKTVVDKVLNNRNITLVELRNDALAMASCKMSIKANQVLNEVEMNKAISDLYKCENPFTCPHGRPIITKMDKKDLEKMFKRIV